MFCNFIEYKFFSTEQIFCRINVVFTDDSIINLTKEEYLAKVELPISINEDGRLISFNDEHEKNVLFLIIIKKIFIKDASKSSLKDSQIKK